VARARLELAETSIYSFPHAFISRRGEPVLVKVLSKKRHAELVAMYLAYEPRNSFSGLPPLSDAVCTRWAEGLIATGINLVALSFDKGIVGHVALCPVDAETAELLIVVAPADQRTGIGTELTRCAVQLAHELGFEQVKLSVEAGNHIARHVYEKCGFEYRSRGLIGELDMCLDLQRFHGNADVTVGDVMSRQPIVIRQDAPCRDALKRFLHDGIATLPVVSESGELTGILSETDLLAEANVGKRVAEVLTREVVSVQETCSVAKAIRLFRSRKLRCIPVLNRRRELVGVVGRRDILAHYARRLAERS
jgi:CBS domain-containing protein